MASKSKSRSSPANSRKKSPTNTSTNEESGSGMGRTWSDMESMKSRLCSHMDRVEYLASARNKLTDIRASQARQMEHTLRSRSKPEVRAKEDLGQSVKAAESMLEEHSGMMKKSNTVWKRLDTVNRFFIDQETKKSGAEWGEAAKRASRGTQPKAEPYPLYWDLHRGPQNQKGLTRDQPVMGVFMQMPYLPPLNAMNHGKRSADLNSNKAMTL